MFKKILENKCLVIMFIVLAFAVIVQADTMTFRNGANGYQGTEDNCFDDYNADIKNINMGETDELMARWSGTNHVSFVLRFNGLDLPSGAIVNAAYITLRNSGGSGNAFGTDVSLISSDNASWAEGTQGYGPAGFGDSSWNHMSFPAEWTGGGGAAGGATSLGTLNVDPAWDGGTEINFDLPNSLVQQWVDGGLNSGLLFRNLSLDGSYMKFRSSEAGPEGWLYRPMLTISYEIPEPVTMVLLGLGGLLIRRKK